MVIYNYKQGDYASRYEEEQNLRIKKIIENWAKSRDEKYIAFFSNINYFHPGLGKEWNHRSWHGEIDLLVIMKNHFIIIEMKSKKAVVKGRTQKWIWEVKYDDTNEFIKEKDYFTQCSEIKTFITQRYYCDYFKYINDKYKNYKLKPDVLLIFKNGSDLSGIWYTPPVRYKSEEYQDILSRLDEEDKTFMEEQFCWDNIRLVYSRKFKQTDEMLMRLERILQKVHFRNRVMKWFHVIEENQIADTLEKCGSEEFVFDEDDIKVIAKHFNMVSY